MEICLVRHAIAVERGTKGFANDDLRPLTPKGRARMREAALGLRELVTPQVVLTSPRLRATETADILVAAYRLPPATAIEPLADGDDRELLEFVRELDASPVMLVGHEPYLSGTLSFLLTGDATTMRADLKKGSAVLVACDGEPEAGAFWLEWLLQPAALRSLSAVPRS